jgi:type VI secretion system secreted protein VgrG
MPALRRPRRYRRLNGLLDSRTGTSTLTCKWKRAQRNQLWRSRSTVHTLRAGIGLTISGTPLQRLGEAAPYTVLRAASVGVNNLPLKAQEALAELLGPTPELLRDMVRDLPPDFDQAIARLRKAGYANRFEVVAATSHGGPS